MEKDRYKKEEGERSDYEAPHESSNHLNYSWNGDVVDMLLKQNSLTLKERIDLLRTQIDQRESLREKVLREFERRHLKIQELLHEVKPPRYYIHHDSQSRRTSLERQLLDIEKEMLAEEIQTWKDISKLHKELVYLEGQYQAERRKYQLMSESNNENDY
jgi:hypothetical protein